MAVTVRDARASARDRRWMEDAYRHYLEDLAPQSTGVFPALREVGHSEADQLARWFEDPRAHPLVIRRASVPVGFAIVAPGSAQPGRPGVDWRMAEFFIARDARRLGVGRTAVSLIFDRFAGRWEVSEFQRNATAVSFWRRVVAAYTRGAYQERATNGEVRQTFDSGPQRLRSG